MADVVTEVDHAIEKITIDTLSKMAPDVRVLGEEGFERDFSITLASQYFVVDPIDGTKEFVKGNSEWSISLCLVEDAEPTVALICMPDRKLTFTAIRGMGVELNGVPLQVRIKDDRKKIGVSPRQIQDIAFKKAVEEASFVPVEISALTPKICALLEGDVDGSVYFPQYGQSAALW